MRRRTDIFIRSDVRRGKKSPLSRVATIIFVLSLILVNYWVFLKDHLTISAPSLEQTIQPPPGTDVPATAPSDAVVPVDVPEEKPATTVAGELHSGETVLQAMQKLGVETKEALPVINAMEDVLDFRSARAGDTFKIEMDEVGKVMEFQFQQSPVDVYVVKRDNGRYAAAKKSVPMETKVVSIGCAMHGSLYRSFQRCGGDKQLANLFMNLFAWDFNFFEQAREGDTVRILIEKVYVEGRFMDYGRILAAEYDGHVAGRYTVFYFKDPDGIEGYYAQDGVALKKQFLKVPVDYATGTDPNSKPSFEPKKVQRSQKLAVRYPAPPRAQVWSVASGTVTFAGEVQKQGWVVEIQHAGGYSSRYSGLARIAKGVSQGSQVFQKSVIGRLGETKGKKPPRLEFALKKGKKYVDHMGENFPGGEPVPDKYRELFDKTVGRYLDELRTLDVMGLEDSQT